MAKNSHDRVYAIFHLPFTFSPRPGGASMLVTCILTMLLAAAPLNTQNPPPKPPPEQQKPAPTMTGTWLIEAHHSAGVSTPTATVTQTGEKLTGKYVGSYGESVITGSIKDNKDFTFSVEIGTEQKVTVVYTGVLEGDTIKGSLTMGEMGEGTFTGKRK
jgi:hypothetical protein